MNSIRLTSTCLCSAKQLCCYTTLASSRPLIEIAFKKLLDNKENSGIGRRKPPKYVRSNNTQLKPQWRVQIRQSLSAKLEFEYQREMDIPNTIVDKPTSTRRHTLVRELMATLRKLCVAESFSTQSAETFVPLSETTVLPDDEHSDANTVISNAWFLYSKIRNREDAAELMDQLPFSATSLLICELTLMSGSLDYRRRFERVVQIVEDFAELGHPVTGSMMVFSMYLRALNKLDRHRQVLDEVHSRKTQQLSMSVMRQLMDAYFGCGRPDKAIELFEELRTSAVYQDQITPHTYSTAIAGALQSRSLADTQTYALIEDLMALLERPAYTDVSRIGLVNELLHAANKKGDNPQLVFYIFERYLARGFPINYTTFGILLNNACNVEADSQQLRNVYKSIYRHPIARSKMTHHIYAVFINCFIRHRLVDHAWSVLQDLRLHSSSSSVQYTAQHLNPFFRYYAETGLALKALELFHTMTYVDGLQPTWAQYADIVKAIAGDEKNHHIVETPGISYHDSLLMMVVKGAQANYAGQMLEAFWEMNRRFPQSVLSFVAVFIHAHRIISKHARYVLTGPWNTRHQNDESQYHMLVGELQQITKRLIESITDGTISDVPPTMLNTAVSAFALARDYETVQTLYEFMTATLDIEPSQHLYDVLIQSFICGSDLNSATDILQDLKSNQFPLNLLTVNTLVHAFLAANQPQQAIETYCYVVGRPSSVLLNASDFRAFTMTAPIDVYTFVQLISGLVNAGLLKEAVVVFEDSFSLLPDGVVPRRLLETLVSRLEYHSQVDLAQLCLRRYMKRVEDSQPPAVADVAGPTLPFSYFGYLLSNK